MKNQLPPRATEVIVLVCFLLLRAFGLLMLHGLFLTQGWETGAIALPCAIGALWFTKIIASFVRAPWQGDEVALDEGGLRWRYRGKRGYVPMSELTSVKAGSRWQSKPTVVLTTARETLRLSTGGASADFFETEYTRLQWRRRYVRPPVHPDLAREGRALGAWLAAVRRARGIGGNDAYRTGERVDEALVALACDRKADVEPRAAAAHLALSSRDEEAIARVLGVFGTSTPPVVVIAAALGAPHRVDVARLEDALDRVSLEEEHEARALLAKASVHVRVAVPGRVDEIEDPETAREQQQLTSNGSDRA